MMLVCELRCTMYDLDLNSDLVLVLVATVDHCRLHVPV